MVNVLTLFSGRWRTWKPYWEGLKNLKFDKKKLKLIWYTAAGDGFIEFLQYQAQQAKQLGFNIELYKANIRPSRLAFSEGKEGLPEHITKIASMYSSAMGLIPDKKRVFFVEDDVSIQPDSLNYFMRDLNKHKSVSYVCGVLMDRHSPKMLAWNYDKVNGKYMSYPPTNTWGVQSIDLGNLGCALIDFERLDMQPPFFKPGVDERGAEHFLGADISFCFRNKKNLIDYNVRSLHYDSQAKPH